MPDVAPGSATSAEASSTDVASLHEQIFAGGSKTYYNSSRIFPPAIRKDVFTLYAFVRVADNLVDDVPQQPGEFRAFRQRWRNAMVGKPAGDMVIDPFVALSKRVGFDPQWTEDFLAAMESDLGTVAINTLDEVLRYTWGSAEVIGLYMMRILNLPEAARETACLMGRSMQFINFLRDVAEDHALGRRYLPLGESGSTASGLTDLTPESVAANPEAFCTYMRGQTSLYTGWQKAAQQGYGYLPWRLRLAVKTASDLYNWTAQVIMRDPMEVWRRKIKPGKLRILGTALRNLFYIPPALPRGDV
ncbi:MAG: phytoene/squalene synthase family protein [Spirochaetales bacterium]